MTVKNKNLSQELEEKLGKFGERIIDLVKRRILQTKFIFAKKKQKKLCIG
jgi:hypothetical protein